MSELMAEGDALTGGYFQYTRDVHVVRMTASGSIKFVNDAMATRLGGTRKSLIGQPLLEFLAPGDAVVVARCLEQQTTTSVPVLLHFLPPAAAPFSLTAVLTADPESCILIGEPPGGVDVAPVPGRFDAAAVAVGDAAPAPPVHPGRRRGDADHRINDEALATIVHELRQPLSAAMAALPLVTRRSGGDSPAAAVLERQLHHLSGLVEDLFDTFQVIQGTLDLDRRPVDLRSIVRDVADGVGPSVAARRQVLTIHAPETPLVAEVDAGRMRQVVSNLVTNAIKYTSAGGRITVSLDLTTDGGQVLRVSDTGQGIAPGDLERVFHLFVRASRGGSGLGIGLAVARRLTELHGGTLVARSPGAGLGSEFVITLPAAAAAG